MEDALSIVFGLCCAFGPFIVMIMVGLVGRQREIWHFRDLDEREGATRGFVATQSKHFLAPAGNQPPAMLVSEVVIASDYLKTYFAKWRHFFGGEVRSYQRMLERARREAALWLIEQASQMGYNAICNVRLETADIGGAMNTKGTAMAAVIATATAYQTSIGSQS